MLRPVAAPRPSLVLFALWLMVFSTSSQVIVIAPLLPSIQEALHIANGHEGFLGFAYATALSLMALVTGPISDRVGRRRVLLVGSVAMTLALALHGLAASFLALCIVRAVAGLAGGMLSGAAVAYVGDFFPYERRGWATGWIMSGMAFGLIAGVPLGTLLAEGWGFRAAFVMFAATMAGATVLIARYVPQPKMARERASLSPGAVVQRYAELLRSLPVAVSVASYFLMFFGFGIYVYHLPLWLETEVLLDGALIASLFAVGGVVNVLASPMAGWLSDVLGRKPLIVTACIGLGLVMLGTTYAVTGLWAAYLMFGLAMMLFAMRMSPLQSLMTALVPDARRGMLMSLAVAIGQVGIGVGSLLAGALYLHLGYAANTFVGAASLLVMAVLIQLGLPEPEGAYQPAAEVVTVVKAG